MGIFGFFRRNRKIDEDYLLKFMEVTKLQMMELAKGIDIINDRIRSPLVKKKLKEGEQEEEPKPSTPDINDGFDEIRRLKKDLSMNN